MPEIVTNEEELEDFVRGMKFDSDTLSLLEIAVMAGWKVMIAGQDSFTLIPYNEKPGQRGKRIHVNLRKPVPLKRTLRQVYRFGDPAKLVLMNTAAIAMKIGQDPKAWETLADVSLDQALIEVRIDLPTEKEKPVPKSVTIPTPKQVHDRVVETRKIISERPALMHRNLTQDGGKSYPSQTTIERRWSDGTVDYACAASMCGETSDNRRAFSGAHWAMHVRKGEAQPHDDEAARKMVVDDPTYTETAWSRKADNRQKRVRDLAEVLGGLDMEAMTPKELAEFIVNWLGDMGGGNGGPREPLTDAEVLDRIRTLCDRGTYAEQEQALFERDSQIETLMDAATAREAELSAALTAMEARAVQAESTMSAFYSLVEEMKP